MSSSSPVPVNSPSTAVIPYNPTLPHCTELVPYNPDLLHVRASNAVDRTVRHFFQISKYQAVHFPQADLRRLYHVLPPLTGPYFVAHSSLELTQPNSTDLGMDRSIGIEIYAPTTTDNGHRLLMQLPSSESGVLNQLQIQTLHTHSQERVVPGENRPILIFSHGMGAVPVLYRPILEQLASNGIVVFSIYHPTTVCNPAFELPMTPEESKRLGEELAARQAKNIRYVFNEVRNGALQGVGDPDRVVFGGHSLGGASSIIAMMPGVKGCINLDGGLVGDDKTVGLNTPLLMILSDWEALQGELADGSAKDRENSNLIQRYGQEWNALHLNSADSRKLNIEDTSHGDFSVCPFLDWLTGAKTLAAGMKVHAIAQREILQFMNARII